MKNDDDKLLKYEIQNRHTVRKWVAKGFVLLASCIGSALIGHFLPADQVYLAGWVIAAGIGFVVFAE